MGSLARWLALNKQHRVVACAGDSTAQGTIYGFNGWAAQLSERLGSYFLGNPGYGYFSPWRYSGGTTGNAIQFLDSNADWPLGAPTVGDQRVFFNGSHWRTGFTGTKTIVTTRPTGVFIHHLDIWYVDATGTNDIEVSVDGGAYFTVPLANLGDHQLKTVTVNQRVSSNIKVRPHAGGVFVFGGFTFWSSSTLPQDCVVHNVAHDGDYLFNFTATAERLDWFDIVQPDLVTCGPWTNDMSLFTDITNYLTRVAAYGTNLQILIDRVSSYADVLILAPFGQNRTAAGRPQADDRIIQAAFRQKCLDVAAANTHVDCLNLFDTWGYYEDSNASGLIYGDRAIPTNGVPDGLHESQAGHDQIAALVYAMVGAGANRVDVRPVLAAPDSSALLDRAYRGVRVDGFVFNLVTANRQQIRALDVIRDSPPTVRNDTTRRSFRTVEGLSAPDKPDDLDLRRHRLQVVMTLQNGTKWPLGIFMFGQNDNEVDTAGGIWSPQLFDENFILDQNLGRSWSLTPGASILEFFKAMAGEVLDPLDIPTNLSVTDVPASSPLTYLVGTSRLDALRALAAVLGCFPPFFANDGTFTLKQAPQLDANSAMDHAYEGGPNSRIFRHSIRQSDTLYKAPNLYIVVGDQLGSGVPVRGTYELPSSAPHSKAQIGYAVAADVHSVPGVSSADVAAQIAYIDALTDRSQYRTAGFSATADPRHDTFETVKLLGAPYMETSWSLQCATGGNHDHALSGLWT